MKQDGLVLISFPSPFHFHEQHLPSLHGEDRPGNIISFRKLFVGPDGLVFISLPSPISSQVGGTPAGRGIDFPLPLLTKKLKIGRGKELPK